MSRYPNVLYAIEYYGEVMERAYSTKKRAFESLNNALGSNDAKVVKFIRSPEKIKK